MWIYTTPSGKARICYDLVMGQFFAFFNDECLGYGCYTPQEAAEKVRRQSPDNSEIPTDISAWEANTQDF